MGGTVGGPGNLVVNKTAEGPTLLEPGIMAEADEDTGEASPSGWTRGSVNSGWISNVCSRCRWWKRHGCYPGPCPGKRDKGGEEGSVFSAQLQAQCSRNQMQGRVIWPEVRPQQVQEAGPARRRGKTAPSPFVSS